MNRKRSLVLVLLAGLMVVFGCTDEKLTPPQVPETGDAEKNLDVLGKSINSLVAGRYIVVLKEGQGDVDILAKDISNRYSFAVDHIYSQALQGFAGNIPDAVAKELILLPEVAAVEQDRQVAALAQDLPTGVDRIETDLSPIAMIDGQPTLVDADVAIIDSGLDMSHPDLNVVGGVSIIGGMISTEFTDDFGHGTHMGGIVAARDNGDGVVGVAPGARLWGVKVLNGWGLGLLSDVISGVDWVTTRSATIEVALLSFGANGYSPALRTAIQNCVGSGVLVVAAAGNGAQDIYGADGVLGSDDDIMPASFPEVATISAMVDTDGRPGGFGNPTPYGSDDSFATFSNFASQVAPGNLVNSPGGAIDLTMPGVEILSTIPGNRYYRASGTSMAAAHAAGLVALHIAKVGRAHNATEVIAIRQALVDNAVAQNDLDGFAIQNDPDPMKEPIGWAIPSGPLADVAITEFTGPVSVVQGDSLVLTAEVTNLGNLEVETPFVVTVSEIVTGAVPASRTVTTLPAGSSRSESVTIKVPLDLAPGMYTLVCAHDFVDQVPGNDRRELVVQVLEGSSTTENIGVFFDTEASLTQYEEVIFGETVTAYIVYNNPTIPTTRGFECGIDIVPGTKDAQIFTVMNVIYPLAASDVGTSDSAAGTYNFITGYGIPLPTNTHTILATLKILYLEISGTPLDFYFRPAIPQSNPQDGLPKLVQEDYALISVAMASLPDQPAMQINAGVTPGGTITINPEPDSLNASWQLFTPDGSAVSSQGDRVLTNMVAGDYTLLWFPETGWQTPASETLALTSGGSIVFTGTYIPDSVVEQIGLFFDTEGTQDTLHVDFLDFPHAYILYLNPDRKSIGGFECGFDLGKASGAPFGTPVSIEFPVQGFNIGTHDPLAGQYNYIVGYGEPLPTLGTTVLGTLEFIILDQETITADLRGSIPSSADGSPVIYTPGSLDIIPVDMPTGPGVPDLTLQFGNLDPPPAAPVGLVLHGSEDSPAEIIINWNNNTEPDLAGYQVFRADNSGGPYTLLNTESLVVDSVYSDVNVLFDVPYYYVVKAVDDAGNESPFSAEASGTASDVRPPAPPEIIQAVTGSEQIHLFWTLSSAVDLDLYNIYRGSTSGGPYMLAGVATATDFIDSSVINGMTYYYMVKAVDVSGNESDGSNEISAIAGDQYPETVGLFFDDQGTMTLKDAAFLDHVPAYILYLNPSLPSTRGFECGIDIVSVVKTAQINSNMTVTYPVPATDVGVSDAEAGTYNYITGYGEPMLTTQQTVLAELDLFYLDGGQLDFYLRASDPESAPITQLPAVVREDFAVYDVPMASDPSLPAMQLNSGQVTTGTVSINPQPFGINAPWDVTTPGGQVISGNGGIAYHDVAAGPYTIIWGEVTGYDKPAPEVLTLVAGGTIIFTGIYTLQTGNENIGLWFDQAASQTCAEASFLDHTPAYIIYSNPNLANIRGFECGIDLTRGGGPSFNTSITVSYPTPSTDVGASDAPNGIYNFIVGYGVPILTTSQTVVGTLDIFSLDSEAINFTLRAAIPASDTSGMPIILNEDFELHDVEMGSSTITLAPPGGCNLPN